MASSSVLLLAGARLGRGSEPVDVRIAGGRISAIEPARGGGTRLPDAATETVDLAGRSVLRGLWDHHVHFDQWSRTSRRLDVSRAGSAAEAAALVGAHVAGAHRGDDLDNGEPIVGYGFRDALWPDRPDRTLLDAATGEVPAVLVSADLHSTWLNSTALSRFGHPAESSGLLRETQAMAVLGALSEVDDETGDRWAAQAAAAAASRGVVGVVDLERPWSGDAWRRRIASGQRSLRVVSAVWAERLDGALAAGRRTGDRLDDELLRMGPLKIITDGSLNTRTAYCFDPYPDLAGRDDEFGLLVVSPEELQPLMRRATEAGLECAIHAIGDHANALALDAFANSGARGSIEHAQLLREVDVARFGRDGIVASVQPEHALDDRDVADRYWAGRTGRAFVLRALLDAGATLTLGSDAPVAPLDPWITIAAAVHRSRDGRPPWHAEQAITVDEALRASTFGGGRSPLPEVGDVADLVITDLDPFTASPDELRTMPVSGTLLAGDWTHRSPALAA
jgi:predicted amidohydrolase YtcJ